MSGETNSRFSETIRGCNSVSEIIRFIRSLGVARNPVVFGVSKQEGVSIERTRKAANQRALELLNSLPDGASLTDEQRQTLAGYTGEGGIGGSTHEYYTPQFVAEGMWEIMKLYGADVGNTLEPSAGAGVFNETKPRGTIMTAAEISTISGRINQLLHPEDKVNIAPFEKLAVSTDDGSFDHCVGNVPFGDARGDTINLDPAYSREKDIGRYFILRLLDKIKAGGLACIIVPYGMTSGTRMKKLREQVSRKAEFLGAHRLPSGTFDENGTPTAVDVWVLRKHPEALADLILQANEDLLTSANVLWPEFIRGKWFEHSGKRFVYGETEKGFQGRIIIRNNQITPAGIKQKLAHRFSSRIDWDQLNVEQPLTMAAAEGELRQINGQWYSFTAGQWVLDTTKRAAKIDPARYGVNDLEELHLVLGSAEGLLGRNWSQLSAIANDYRSSLDEQTRKAITFASTLPEAQRERVFRGAIIGGQIGALQDAIANNYPPEHIDQMRISVVRLVEQELKTFGNPNKGRISKVSGNNSGDWLKFRGAITSEGTLSDFLAGNLEAHTGTMYDSTNHEQVVRHLFNQIDLIPVTLAEFRQVFTGELPEDDNSLLDLLANIDGIAVTAAGDIMPMDRATSGDIGMMSTELRGVLSVVADGPQKNNYLRQLELIKAKRKWTPVDDITFSLNSRWFDRSLVLEFLKDNGYDELTYVENVQVENGALVSEQGYQGRNGVFAGYRYGTVLKRDKESGQMIPTYARKTSGDPFAAQLEKYLNGGKATGVNSEDYLQRIRDLESRFNDWVRQHDELDNLVEQYNNAFNAYIPFKHSDAPLKLDGVSGAITNFGYQNEDVRRLSEDGRGILGYGTGLGKTMTALALEAYNFENGRGKRNAFVVPKSVYENWYYEAKTFYSAEVFSNILFVGLDPVLDENGAIKQVPVLDEQGNQKTDSAGNIMTRDALVLCSAETIKARMNQIPQSNYRSVVMTKDQYAAIPMRAETIRDHAHDVLYAQADAGRVKIGTDSYREQKKKDRILTEHSDTGSAKQQDFPYFEDMLFDSVIVDEGHNYRNSYSAGREAVQLAYLPNGSVAQSARDMAVKNAYLMAKNDGRGPVLLTATPVVNSPIDAFNMLSHCVSMADWQRMGIYTPDDFVKEFGKTKLCEVLKLSGAVELKQGLVGFKNLDGLRGIFHRWTSLKTAEDVKEQVKIPDLDEQPPVEAPMTDEQAAAYEKLRVRAERLSQGLSPDEIRALEGDYTESSKLSIFGIIRDMDRVCTDLDLFNHVITFRFPEGLADAVKRLADDLPEGVASDDTSDEDYGAEAQFKISVKDGLCELVVPEMFEQEVNKRLAKFGIADSDITHPLTPKYSALVENLKEGLKRGKQIIFTDEKSQHGKLKRILCAQLGIDASEVGILNATTVADAGKKGKKPKKVKPPKDLPDEPTEEQVEAYYTQKAAYDEYVATVNEVSLGGLEQIAADYNEGRTRILICNKKAEVGINLHHGTTDIHHLTLPWTPASIDQRNGRGARVGSSQDSVKVHYYCGKGSFDEFRLRTLKRKKNWIKEILTSNQSQMENADAGNMVELQLLLAANPEERERRIAEEVEKARAAAQARAQKRADLDLQNYLKAQHAGAANLDDERGKEFDLQRNAEDKEGYLSKVRKELEKLQEELAEAATDTASPWRVKGIESSIRTTRIALNEAGKADSAARSALLKQQRKIKRLAKSASEIKRLRPVIKKAIDDGILDVDADVIDHGKDILYVNGKTYKVGQVFNFNVVMTNKHDDISYAKITALDFDRQAADLVGLFSAGGTDKPGSAKGIPVQILGNVSDVTTSELDLLRSMQGGVFTHEIPNLLSKDQFYHYLKTGQLRLKDEYGVAYESGLYKKETLNQRSYGYGYGSTGSYRDTTWYSKHGHTLVYPDRSDEQLKQTIAIKERAKADIQYYAQGFIIALYGKDWKTVMEGFGEAASPDVIESYVSKKVAAVTLFSTERDRQMSIRDFIQSGEVKVPSLMGLKFMPWDIPPNYKNFNDFQAALRSAILVLEEQARKELVAGKAEVAQVRYGDFKRTLESKEAPEEKNILKILDGYGTFERMYTGYNSAFDGESACVAAVLGGFIDASAITPELLVNPAGMLAAVQAADNELVSLKEDQLKARKTAYETQRGLVTPEKREELSQNKKQETESKEAVSAKSGDLGIIVRLSTTQVRSKRGINFAAGGCFGLQDPKGKEGALYRAKDELKEKYGAKFLNSWRDDSEFPGSWWLIPSRFDQEEVLSIVAKY